MSVLKIRDENGNVIKIPFFKDGSKWHNGILVTNSGETVVDGSNAGDYYINTHTFDVYYSTTTNFWKFVGNIKGQDGSAGIYIGESEEEVNASGATIWINPSATPDDSYVNEDYVTNALAFKGIKLNSPSATGTQSAGAERTQIYSAVEYNSNTDMFFYDNGTGKVTVNRDGFYEFTASAAVKVLDYFDSTYAFMRIKCDKTAVGGSVGNLKTFQCATCKTSDSGGTAYFNGNVTAYVEAGTVFYVAVGCSTTAWTGNTGAGYNFGITYLGN